MPKQRVMIYHHAGAPVITVETIVRVFADGEELEKRRNIEAKSKEVMTALDALLTAIDNEIGTEGNDPMTAERFKPTIAEEVTEQ